MLAKLLLFLTLLFLLTHTQPTLTSSSSTSILDLPSVLPCVEYQNGNCVICPYNYHINQNQCYRNITGCLVYGMTNRGTQQCVQCNLAVGVLDGNGGCSVTSSRSSLTTQTMSADQAAARYGDNRFRLIAGEVAQADPYFRICNEFMLKGQYKHFIALSAPNPVLYVSFFAVGAQREYKILYNGSGGGIMMCLITINEQSQSKPRIYAFVPIRAGNIIENCAIYNQQMQCIQCASEWHLEKGKCYPNFGGCVAYIQQICIECQKFSILVENKCIGCADLSDLNKIRFIRGGTGFSTMDQSYLLFA